MERLKAGKGGTGRGKQGEKKAPSCDGAFSETNDF
jgi:hypothetical protein